MVTMSQLLTLGRLAMNMKLRPGKAHVALVLAIREVRDLRTFPHSAQG
jgi:hypothetical protein